MFVSNFADIRCPAGVTKDMSTLHPFKPRNLEPELENGAKPTLTPPEISSRNLRDSVTTTSI